MAGSPDLRSASVFISFEFAWFLQDYSAGWPPDFREFYDELMVLKGYCFKEVVVAVGPLP